MVVEAGIAIICGSGEVVLIWKTRGGTVWNCGGA